MKSILSVFWLAAFGLFVSGCEEPIQEDLTPSFDLMEYLASFPSDDAASNTRAAPRPRPQSWVDCELFAGVVTPATFDPANGNFDELYAGGDGFLDMVPLISESKPGDQDYNGGRWHLNALKAGVESDKYITVCSVEDLDLNDFVSTEDYFECPLLPRRGKN
jgi:hypothetical protein